MLGIDVARDMTRAMADLAYSRLVIDLRGNTGGGTGCLRLMSHHCPDRRGVGYSVTRDVAKKGHDNERLPKSAGIPSSKWGTLPLGRVGFAGRSFAVFTEVSGRRRSTRLGRDARQRALGERRRDGGSVCVGVQARDAGRHQDGRAPGGHRRVQGGVRVSNRTAGGEVLHLARDGHGGAGGEVEVAVGATADDLRAGEDRQLQHAVRLF